MDDDAGLQSGQKATGKKQRNTGKAAGKKQENGALEKALDEDGESSQASDLTMAPSSPAAPRGQPQLVMEVTLEISSVSEFLHTVEPNPAEAELNGAKRRTTRSKRTMPTTGENGNEEATYPSLSKVPDPVKPKSKRKPVAPNLKETVSKRSTSLTKPKVMAHKTAKNGAIVKPKASTSSTASSPKKTTKVKRNGKVQAVVPTSKQITDGIEAMYFGSSQPYASGTTMLSDSESSDEDERMKVSRLFDPVKRTPQKRKGKDVEEDGIGKRKKANKGKKGQDDDATSAEETAAESEIEYPKLRRDLE